MFVTIYIPTFNHEKFIASCLTSAFNQDYTGQTEIIIWDNCSEDSNLQIIDKLIAEYSGDKEVRLIKSPINHFPGFYMTNTVMEEANGEFIICLSGDDYMDKSRVRCLLDAYEKSKASTIASSVYEISEDGQVLRLKNRLLEKPGFKQFSDANDFVENGGSPVCHGASFAWHREVFDVFGPLREGPRNADVAIPFRGGLLKGNYYVEEPLVYRRLHKDNVDLGEIEKKLIDKNDFLIMSERKKANRIMNYYVMLEDLKNLKKAGMLNEKFNELPQKMTKRILTLNKHWMDIRYEMMMSGLGVV